MAANPFLERSTRISWLLLLLILGLLVTITACGGNEEPVAPAVPITAEQAPAGAQLRLDCNSSCAERAQCGERAGGGQVVLMNRGNPAVSNHDMALPAGTTIIVQESRAENVREIVSQQVFVATFLRVLTTDQAQEGWVPIWCVAN